ncbi:spermidine/putrescine ABC transporter substrate-binding protein [Seleniivibrio sp.]|uniref:ABC transporter substrate-binding protein n=1 Tax=Seleniivibrio sp. TaxID=2898801 RepID=UPI0025FCA70A|nr:spermidine/putrescine ABC transporter substrate-binding protein [Seleniivibrio sp.]MCD8554870.1 spermidine/putrescine ABC transporter substrate-binding protein [Seleniivibrio sp.]
MKRLIFAILLCLLASSAFAKEVVYVYNWSEYIPEQVLSNFEKETGIKVIYTTYDSNEVMYSKVKVLGGKGYDVIFPSTYYVNRMQKEGLLTPLNKKLLPNIKNMEPSLMNKPYDEGNKYSVPYLWGSTSLAINSDFVDEKKANTYRILWDSKYKGKVILTDDLREVFHIALRILGYSGNETDPEKIKKAYELLRKLRPNVRVYNSDSPKVPFINGEVTLGLTFNGEMYAAAQENPAIKYIYPKEGAIFWVDSMCIPKGSKNVANAHKFINYIMKPEVAKLISEEVGYPSPNKAGVALLDKSVRTNATIYPPLSIIKQGEFQLDVGDAIKVYEKYWNLLKSGK